MNLTLSIDDELVARARKVAEARGISLQQLVRDHLEALVGRSDPELWIDEMHDLDAHTAGRSGGRKPRREDAYEGRRFEFSSGVG